MYTKHQAIERLAIMPAGSEYVNDYMFNGDQAFALKVCEVPNYNGGTMNSILMFLDGIAVPLGQHTGPCNGWRARK